MRNDSCRYPLAHPEVSMRLDDCITRAARIWPGRPATRFRNRSRTWHQVAEDVRILAADLRALGVEPGDRVAVLGENSDRYLDTFFAVSWVGAVIVPLNTRLAGDELAACLLDSGPRLLVSDEAFADRAALAAAVPRLRRASYLGAAAGLRDDSAEGTSLPRLRAPYPRAGRRASSFPTTTCSPAPGMCCPRSAGTKTPCSCTRPRCTTCPASAAWSQSRRWRDGTSSCPASTPVR
jgi:acyl-CoA synthetase (AMP-forming)/AMP-acid ligase II